MSARKDKSSLLEPENWGRPLTDAEAERLAELLYEGLRKLGWFDCRQERPVTAPFDPGTDALKRNV